MVSKKDKYLAAAQRLVERGQLDKALVEFARVVQEDPKDTRTWLKMAELHAKRGENAEAADIYLRTGDLYTEQGFTQKAVAVYKNVLKLSPTTLSAHQKLGAIFQQMGLVPDAVQQFELASVGFQQAGQFPQAVAALQQAVALQPGNVVLRVNLAESASQAGMIDDAVREFGHAADALKAAGRTDEYFRVSERLLFHRPDELNRARELADAYVTRGSPRLALPKLQACLKADARDTRTLSLLAKALEQLGQTAKAVSVLKELVRLCQELGRVSERDAAIVRGLTLEPAEAELQSLALRFQLRGAYEATPPPISTASGTFDLSGVVRGAGPLSTAGFSGRVVALSDTSGDSGASGRVRRNASDEMSSASGEVARILAETDVFVKYELFERAVTNLARVFAIDSTHREARERLILVLTRLGRSGDAAREMVILAEQLAAQSPEEAKGLAQRAIQLAPQLTRAHALLDGLSGHVANSQLLIVSSEDDPNVEVQTPPVVELSSGPEILSMSDDIESMSATPPPVVEGGGLDVDDDVDSVEISFDREDDAGVSLAVPPEEQETPPPQFSQDEATRVSAAPPGPVRSSATPGMPLSWHGASVDTEMGLDRDVLTPILQLSPRMVTDDEGDDPTRAFGESNDDDVDLATVIDEEHAASLALISAVESKPRRGPAAKFAIPTQAPSSLGATSALTPAEEEDLEGELEQVSFFLDQAMFDDAQAMMDDLQTRFGDHPRLVEMREEVAAAKHLVVEPPEDEDEATWVIRSDETPDPGEPYWRLGLFDAAIEEYKRLSRDPAREIFALTKMGDCFLAKSSYTEAILRYKRALNCDDVTREEARLLYYQLGATFERLGDISEALYFYEKVSKRDPEFKDVSRKIAELIPRKAKRA